MGPTGHARQGVRQAGTEGTVAKQVEIEAYALGYFYGRGVGSDEPGFAELAERGWDDGDVLRSAFKNGYERGVADFCEYEGSDDG
jgi:hypothetical protein